MIKALLLLTGSVVALATISLIPTPTVTSMPPTEQDPAVLTQSIQGQVLRLTGNQMPGAGSSGGNSEPVQTRVWVFSGQIAAQNGPNWSLEEARRHPALTAVVPSDETGRYTVLVPPGEYTLLAEYGDRLYLNSFSGNGTFSTVTVMPDAQVNLNLQNTEAAFF